MSTLSDADLDAMDAYGGPDGGKGEARELLTNLRAARAELRRIESLVARPAVAAAIRATDQQHLLQRQAAERAAAGL